MEKARRVLLLILFVLFYVLLGLSKALESPEYAVVHTESEFEVRLYTDATWIAAPVTTELSFQKATFLGFRRLFQYIQGANLNWTRLEMTTPAVTSIIPEAGPLHSSGYVIGFYLPAKFQDDPPLALPELNLKTYEWDSHCVAVRKFSGFATDDNIVKEAKKLATSLSRSPWANFTISGSEYAYSIAQYDPPFRLIGRVNEIWADVDSSKISGCGNGGKAAY
ncbi:hypothetical protein ACFE04_028445 [Oxalis oulophora]